MKNMLKERWIKMKDYGRVRSTVNPKPMVIDEFSVWIHKNITEVSENVGEENEFIGYEYDMIQYEKDEYIELLSEQNETFLETLDTLTSEVIPSLMM
jgi:hypothetical protein